MENSKKNTPGPVVIIGIAAVVIIIISYFILLMFFPDFFQGLQSGQEQPVTN